LYEIYLYEIFKKNIKPYFEFGSSGAYVGVKVEVSGQLTLGLYVTWADASSHRGLWRNANEIT
jgi:hypothetical protein